MAIVKHRAWNIEIIKRIRLINQNQKSLSNRNRNHSEQHEHKCFIFIACFTCLRADVFRIFRRPNMHITRIYTYTKLSLAFFRRPERRHLCAFWTHAAVLYINIFCVHWRSFERSRTFYFYWSFTRRYQIRHGYIASIAGWWPCRFRLVRRSRFTR